MKEMSKHKAKQILSKASCDALDNPDLITAEAYARFMYALRSKITIISDHVEREPERNVGRRKKTARDIER